MSRAADNSYSLLIKESEVNNAALGTLRINSPFFISRTAAKPLLHNQNVTLNLDQVTCILMSDSGLNDGYRNHSWVEFTTRRLVGSWKRRENGRGKREKGNGGRVNRRSQAMQPTPKSSWDLLRFLLPCLLCFPPGVTAELGIIYMTY